MSWYVLYTKPRNEKKVTAKLTDMGVQVYCPLHTEIRQWSDRKKKVQEPVFKGYVFVKLKDYKQDSVDVLNLAGAVRFLWWNGKPGIVREYEIKAIQDFLDDYKNTDVKIEIEQGEEMVVNEGPLKDSRGKVMQVKGNIAVLHLKSLGLNIVAKLPIQSLSKTNN
ncbi:MAG: UpxY family transcription antiterminator [Chitinophagales bacterium]|nr:UpxY family transcription antiterminator [Chitinophagaceae bacterium]MCB9065378.1 UpxY family transcription antiterminator [Chitinophagales bacterium]